MYGGVPPEATSYQVERGSQEKANAALPSLDQRRGKRRLCSRPWNLLPVAPYRDKLRRNSHPAVSQRPGEPKSVDRQLPAEEGGVGDRDGGHSIGDSARRGRRQMHGEGLVAFAQVVAPDEDRAMHACRCSRQLQGLVGNRSVVQRGCGGPVGGVEVNRGGLRQG